MHNGASACRPAPAPQRFPKRTQNAGEFTVAALAPTRIAVKAKESLAGALHTLARLGEIPEPPDETEPPLVAVTDEQVDRLLLCVAGMRADHRGLIQMRLHHAGFSAASMALATSWVESYLADMRASRDAIDAACERLRARQPAWFLNAPSAAREGGDGARPGP